MKIGLALSGGGALGAAHLGVLEELENKQIQIDRICGTSAGAIVGLLYCEGGVPLVKDFFSKLEASGLIKKTNIIFLRNSVIFSRVEEILRSCIKSKDFSDLKVNFSCMATDLAGGVSVELKTGDLVKSVMASCAYPTVFPVQKVGKSFLVDGGLTRNLPAGILHEHGIDFVIGSSLYKVGKIDKFDSNGNLNIGSISVAIRALDIIQKELAEQEVSKCDFCFEPEIHNFKWYNFSELENIKIIGQECAKKKINDLMDALEKKSKEKIKHSFWRNIFRVN